jgi:hypothetical protein
MYRFLYFIGISAGYFVFKVITVFIIVIIVSLQNTIWVKYHFRELFKIPGPTPSKIPFIGSVLCMCHFLLSKGNLNEINGETDVLPTMERWKSQFGGCFLVRFIMRSECLSYST